MAAMAHQTAELYSRECALPSCRLQETHDIVPAMIRITVILPLCLALLSAGCATYSKEECSSGDWEKIGQRDGEDGRSPDKFDLHVKACKLDRSAASRAAYMAGREKGLANYCTGARGYREGVLGQQYLGACPSTLEPQFQKGYKLGRKIYTAESRQSDLADAIRAAPSAEQKQRLEAENAKLRKDIEALRAQGDTLILAARKKRGN